MQPERTTDLGSRPSYALRYHLPLIALCAVLGAALGGLYLYLRPAEQTSTAKVLVTPAEGNPYSPSPRNDQLTSLETEAQLVESDAVLSAAAAQTSAADTAAELARGVVVTVPPNTQILDISYTASDPDVVKATAQAIAEAYLQVRSDRAQGIVDAQVARIDAQIKDAIGNLRSATRASREGPIAERPFQSRLADALSTELVSLRTERADLLSSSPQAGTVVSPAQSPRGSGLVKQVAVPLGAGIAGAVVGFLLALWRERRLDLVRAARDVEELGVPVLAAMPRLSRRKNRSSGRASVAFDLALQRILALLLEGDRPSPIISVHASSPGVPEPGLAAALATTLAQAERTVVLVGDPHPWIAARGKRRAAEMPAGLTDVLAGHAEPVERLLLRCEDSGLYWLPTGSKAAESLDVFRLKGVDALLRDLSTMCDVLIVAAPSVETPPGRAIALSSTLAVLVVRCGTTRNVQVQAFVGQTEQLALSHGAVVAAAKGPRAVLPAPCQTWVPAVGRPKASHPVAERSADWTSLNA